jgi:hypothetical protein
VHHLDARHLSTLNVIRQFAGVKIGDACRHTAMLKLIASGKRWLLGLQID